MPRNRVGSIRKRGSRWKIEVMRGSSEDGTVRRLYGSIPATRPYEEAQALAVSMAQRLGDGRAAAEQDMTLRTFFETVFPSLPSSRGTVRSRATMRQYGAGMRRALELFGDTSLRDISHTDVARAVRESSSPRNAKTALRAVLRSAYDQELIDEAPFQRRVPTHSERKPKPVPWSPYEVAAFFRAAQSVPLLPKEERDDLIAFAVLGLCGLSKSEALGVRPMDVRTARYYSPVTGRPLESMTVTVAKTYTDDDGWKDWAKNDGRPRTVPVPHALRPILTRAMGELSGKRGDGWGGERIVARTSSNTVRDWRALCKRLGVRYIPPGMLRHTTDTIALTAGVQSDLNDRMHGRAEHSSTYRHYFLPDIGAMDEAAKMISDVLITPDHGEQVF